MNFKNLKFLLILSLTTITLVAVMAYFNKVIDPQQKLLIFDTKSLDQFNKAMNSSAYGTRLPKILSLPKLSLLKNSQNKELAIIGNSQTYICGHSEQLTPLDYRPDQIINTSLSHLGGNEMLFLLETVYQKGIRKVFMVLPHNYFQRLRLERWSKMTLEKMTELQKEFQLNSMPSLEEDHLKLLKYFFSFKTFWQSIDHIRAWGSLKLEKNYARPLKNYPDLNSDFRSFILKNGSTAWSSDYYEYLLKNRAYESDKILKALKVKIVDYGLDKADNRRTYISKIKKIVQAYKEKGMSFHFFIGPIFMNYLKSKGAQSVIEFYQTYQQEMVAMATELGVPIFGGIKRCGDQMYDLFHPLPNCLEKALRHPLN